MIYFAYSLMYVAVWGFSALVGYITKDVGSLLFAVIGTVLIPSCKRFMELCDGEDE